MPEITIEERLKLREHRIAVLERELIKARYSCGLGQVNKMLIQTENLSKTVKQLLKSLGEMAIESKK